MSTNEPGQPPITSTSWTSALDTPRVALAIGAHPDDVEFGAGGTLAKWADHGCVVHHVVCTDGSKGTWDVEADLPSLVERRQGEQREAGRRLSGERAGEVRFLGAVDGELEPTVEHRIGIVRAIRELRPDVVLGHDPWKRYRLHPDHRAAGLLTCDAVVAARDPHFFPDVGPSHHRPSHLFLFEADEPDHVEDVTASVGRKLDALHAHESQFESTMHAADAAELAAFDERITARLAELGAPHGVELAEVFKRISDL
ncbi:LmbE family N-acetylglucosaminyl deacetylase [Ilumatobacter fluminis]|uniref:LmbE family N-acetylglucosaminyl deacetylase n=1 Tax=Ilumatobacter fluminis TaxID=467091 RepID=A0A4R7I3U1_9ACTN|nr:PIG-L deacetylase family protein [Ilumatobacter fluminis]TDT17619.1 LmbE family N-acetylglucosaminyl deacetylase [Ilumatobacter fluminis]